MRILQLHARYRVPAGEDAVVDAEAEALRTAGHDVEQFLVPNPTSPAASVNALVRSLHNSDVADRVSTVIDRFAPDVVHVHNTWFALSSSVVSASAATGTPVVMTLHNFRLGCVGTDLFRDGAVCTACLGRSPLPGVLHGCYRNSRLLSAVQAAEVTTVRRRRVLDRHVTTFVAPSTFMADRLLDIGVPAERLVVKPHFVDDPGPRPRAPSSSDEILSVGRIAPGKGIGTLLNAWDGRRGAGGRLTVIGDGPLRSELQATAASDVAWTGWLDRTEIRARLQRARALVMPSELYEAFGMVLIEALSAGLPVIVTTVAGAAEVVQPPSTLLVPPADSARLAAAIDVLADDGVVDDVGRTARARYLDRYTEATGVTALERLYGAAIDTPARGRGRNG